MDYSVIKWTIVTHINRNEPQINESWYYKKKEGSYRRIVHVKNQIMYYLEVYT